MNDLMNKDRMLELADHIEKLPAKEFNMKHYVHECGSPYCIAGWAVHFWAPDDRGSPYHVGQRVLDLTELEADTLFLLLFEFVGSCVCLEYITNTQVAEAIRKMANGAVSMEVWSHVV